MPSEGSSSPTSRPWPSKKSTSSTTPQSFRYTLAVAIFRAFKSFFRYCAHTRGPNSLNVLLVERDDGAKSMQSLAIKLRRARAVCFRCIFFKCRTPKTFYSLFSLLGCCFFLKTPVSCVLYILKLLGPAVAPSY